MPERLAHWWDQIIQAGLFAVVGILIGIGRLLEAKEPLTLSLMVGRAISTGGLAMAAGTALVWVPDLPLLGQIGIAAALSSLGTTGLERLFRRAIAVRTGEQP